MIRIVHGPKKHLIARVNINADGAIIPVARDGVSHGLTWDFNPKKGEKGISLIRATCPKSSCNFDWSRDYEWLRDELARAVAESSTDPAEYVLKG